MSLLIPSYFSANNCSYFSLLYYQRKKKTTHPLIIFSPMIILFTVMSLISCIPLSLYHQRTIVYSYFPCCTIKKKKKTHHFIIFLSSDLSYLPCHVAVIASIFLSLCHQPTQPSPHNTAARLRETGTCPVRLTIASRHPSHSPCHSFLFASSAGADLTPRQDLQALPSALPRHPSVHRQAEEGLALTDDWPVNEGRFLFIFFFFHKPRKSNRS